MPSNFPLLLYPGRHYCRINDTSINLRSSSGIFSSFSTSCSATCWFLTAVWLSSA